MTRFVLTSAMCLALAASSQAFVSPSFVTPHHTLPATYTRHVTATSRSSSSTALQMNLFDRFSRVAKANLNNVLQNLEDPEKIMTQALEDMQVSEMR
jgi:phage shock protein A